MGVLKLSRVIVIVCLSRAAWACTPIDVSVFSGESPEPPEPPTVLPGVGGYPDDGGEHGMGGEVTATEFGLDNFEDMDSKANDPAGWWYLVNDGTGTQELDVIAADEVPVSDGIASGYLLQVSSRDFTGWGSAWGVDIAEVVPKGSALELTFSIAANRSAEVALHAIDGSGDHFTRTVALTPSWSRVVVRLDQLFIVEAESVRAFDVATATEIQWFLFDGTATTLWLDDVVLRHF